MQKFLIQLVLIVLLIMAAAFVSFRQGGILNVQTIFTPPTKVNKLKINDTIVNVEIAETKEKRTKGLGERDSIASNSGMLFVFDSLDKYKFWMKGMKFSLDFIWIKDDTVVDILNNIPPPTPGQSTESLPVFAPITYVNKVLEVNSGFVASHNIKVGDKVELLR